MGNWVADEVLFQVRSRFFSGPDHESCPLSFSAAVQFRESSHAIHGLRLSSDAHKACSGLLDRNFSVHHGAEGSCNLARPYQSQNPLSGSASSGKMLILSLCCKSALAFYVCCSLASIKIHCSKNSCITHSFCSQARIHPEDRGNGLSEDQVEKLHHWLHEVGFPSACYLSSKVPSASLPQS